MILTLLKNIRKGFLLLKNSSKNWSFVTKLRVNELSISFYQNFCINIQFHWQIWTTSILLTKSDTSSKKEMRMMKTQIL